MANNQFDDILVTLIQREEERLRADFAAFRENIAGELEADFNDENDFDERIKSVYDKHQDELAVSDEVVYNTMNYHSQRNARVWRTEAASERVGASKVSYAASLGMRIALNLCIAKNIKDGIDAYHAEAPKKDLNDEERAQLKNYVDEKFDVQWKTQSENVLFGTIKNRFDLHIFDNGTTRDFLAESYRAFEDMYSQGHEQNRDELLAEVNSPKVEINNHHTLHDALYHANMNYVKDTRNTAIAPVPYTYTCRIAHEFDPFDEKFTKDIDELDDSDFDKVSVNPESFLESYNKWKKYEAGDKFPEIKKLVKKEFEESRKYILESDRRQIKSIREEKDWSDEYKEEKIQELKDNMKELSEEDVDAWSKERVMGYFKNDTMLKGNEALLPSYQGLSQAELEYCDNFYNHLSHAFDRTIKEFLPEGQEPDEFGFKVDGALVESRADLVAGALSGKKITKDYLDGDTLRTVTIQPELYAWKERKFETDFDDFERDYFYVEGEEPPSAFDKFLNLLNSVLESIRDLFGVSEKAKSEKMNEKIQENQARKKTSFAEIANEKFSDKLISHEKREKIEAKQKENRERAERNAPIINR